MQDVIVFGDWALYGFDAASGELRWRFDQPDATGVGAGVYRFKTDGSLLYAGSTTGAVFAIDPATGTQVWRTDLLSGVDNEVRVMAVQAGRVYLTVRYSGLRYSGKACAVDAATGTIIWSYELPRDDGSPNATRDATLTLQGQSASILLVSFDDGRIAALDATNGVALWIIPALGTENDDRRMTVSATTLVATSTVPDMIVAYDLETGKERWRAISEQGSAQQGFGRVSSDANHAFVVFTNGVVGAYDLQTGARRWLRRAPVGFFVDAPLIDGDTFFLGGYDAAYAMRP